MSKLKVVLHFVSGTTVDYQTNMTRGDARAYFIDKLRHGYPISIVDENHNITVNTNLVELVTYDE